jgi:hypothetical protein
MTATGRKVLAAVALLAIGLAPGCGDEETKGSHQIWFMGSVYNGATGSILSANNYTPYEISLVSGTTTIRGTVDANGRYTLGPLQAWNDYAITITAADFRAFTSYNSGIAPPTPPPASQASDVYTANTTQTFDFDAYLFPTGLQASGLTISIVKPDGTAAAGSLRLRPTSVSSIQDQTAGVTGQVWANDQDMLAAVHSRDFTDGLVSFAAEELVYGVTYQVTVYDVDGYQPATSSVRGGLQDTLIVNMTTTASPLQMVSNTIMMCRPAGQSTNVRATAVVTFTFNQSVEDVTPVTSGRAAEVLDDGIVVSTMLGATLRQDLSNTQSEHGTSFMLSGNMVQIAWDPSMGLNTPSATDTINSVTWGGLTAIMLQPIGHSEFVRSLASMLPNGATMPTIYCAN